MSGILALVGALFAGTQGAVLALLFAVGLSVFGPRLSARWMLSRRGARQLHPRDPIARMVADLTRRAGVPTPAVYVVPSPTPNAFTAGEGRDAVLGISPSLVRMMSRRELRGVLAHEVAHLVHRDTRVMRTAATFRSLTHSMASFGLLLALLQLPLALFGAPTLPLSALLVMLFAPTLSGALELMLARDREHDADAAAARLTGDPRALASALLRLDARERSMLRWLPFGAPRVPEWLRTHPPTGERVRRLLAMRVEEAEPADAHHPSPAAERPEITPVHVVGSRKPRRGRVVFEMDRPAGWAEPRKRRAAS